MLNLKKSVVFVAMAILSSTISTAQKKLDDVLEKLDSKSESYGEIAQTIWDLAEMGYQEEKASLYCKNIERSWFYHKRRGRRYAYRFYCRIW